jgi:hypothetical protein
MYTSIVLAALLGPGAAGPQDEAVQAPTWQENYATARKVGREQNKPLAVFIGRGPDGPKQLSQDGELTAEARKLLADSYVCVYLDASTPAGKRLADRFSLPQGLVVSSRDGENQAFRHSGRMSGKDLDATLRRYSNGYVSLRTEFLEEEEDAPKEKEKAKPKAGPAKPAHPPAMAAYPCFSAPAYSCGSVSFGCSWGGCGRAWGGCGRGCGRGGRCR